jgi:hypothetical protein
LGLNTYAKSLAYFTLKKREKRASTDIAITISRSVDILAGYIWTGYDQGSQFEAGCRVWFEPSVATWKARKERERIERIPEEILKVVRLRTAVQGTSLGASVMLGGTYLHKHNTTQTAYQNDFYPLQQLRDIKPVRALPGSLLVIDRDIFNIDPVKTFNAWDIELILVVSEIAVVTVILRAIRRALCRVTQAVLVRMIRTLGYRRML